MGILEGILAIIALASQIFSLFSKSPEEKREALIRSLEQYVKDLHQAVKKSQDSGGDTSALEDIINRRR